ncbi:hypothetical protein [Salinibius halmophilus]|uniref:hypothetical protein n=1 Tax=Salinibius halmophilus TaxID=1853216 RepID=UPI000E675B46|nr:hypothetical protein [Salinibius halmophilus]
MKKIIYYLTIFDAVVYALVGYHAWIVLVHKAPMVVWEYQIGSFWYENYELRSWLVIGFLTLVFLAGKRLYTVVDGSGVTDRMIFYKESISWGDVYKIERKDSLFSHELHLYSHGRKSPWRVNCKKDRTIFGFAKMKLLSFREANVE